MVHKYSSKESRLEAIRRILADQAITSQAALGARLRRAGHAVSQGTLSRDLRGLGVAKQPGSKGGYVYRQPEAGSAEGPYLAAFLRMDFSGSLAIVRTLSGHAMSVKPILDEAGIEGVIGTVAGDDTILVVPADGVGPDRLRRSVLRKMPQLAERIGGRKLK